ncbi:MAG: PAS domain S-box protein [Planctomycetaceae bacterium]|nr:PAS domain S-box protein [Planctomycetaceae bacterium]
MGKKAKTARGVGLSSRQLLEAQQSRQLKAVFESSQDCLFVCDRDHNCLYANKAAVDHVRTTEDKVIGKNIHSGLSHIPDFLHLWTDRIDEVFRTQSVLRVEDSVTLGDRLVHSESVLSPLHYPDGQMFAVGIVYRDITYWKDLLRQLDASQRRYRDLYNHAQVPLFVTNADGLLLDCNLRTLDLFGYSRDEPRDKYIHKFRVTDTYVDSNRRNEFILSLRRCGQVNGFEAELKRADGMHFWVSISAMITEAGLIEGVLYDITASKVMTKIEKRILSLILQGKSNKEAAHLLHRSVRTVEDHRSRIMQKLGAHNLVELVQKASILDLHERLSSQESDSAWERHTHEAS